MMVLAAVLAPALAAERPNVIVVVVDALRARNLGAYGHTRPTSPNFDKWAAKSVLFEDAISQSGWTPWSIGSLFSTLEPTALKCSVQPACSAQMWLAPEIETMAERFRGAGYSTAMLTKSWALPEVAGFDQGFDRFEIVQKNVEVAEGRSGQILTDAALGWIDQQSTPFFLYLHYMDVHAPYRAPPPWFDMFSKGYAGSFMGRVEEMEPFVKGEAVPTVADLTRMQALYDGEIAYFDSQFARLLAHLEQEGLTKNTVVALTADHGEGFYEHRNLSHGHIWQENIHVPLVVSAPGAPARRVEGWVQQNSLAPTLADLAGLGAGRDWKSASLAAVVRGGELVAANVYSEMGIWRTVIDAQSRKLVAAVGSVQLFDLAEDPDERSNNANTRPDEARKLVQLLQARRVANEAIAATLSKPQSSTVEDLERKQQLEALGYTE